MTTNPPRGIGPTGEDGSDPAAFDRALSDALQQLASETPDVSVLVHPGRRPKRRWGHHTPWLIAAAVVAAVAIPVGVVTLKAGPSQEIPPAQTDPIPSIVATTGGPSSGSATTRPARSTTSPTSVQSSGSTHASTPTSPLTSSSPVGSTSVTSKVAASKAELEYVAALPDRLPFLLARTPGEVIFTGTSGAQDPGLFTVGIGTPTTDAWIQTLRRSVRPSASVETLNGRQWGFWKPSATSDGAGGPCLLTAVGPYELSVCNAGDGSSEAVDSLRRLAAALTISDSPTPSNWYSKRQALGLDAAASTTKTSGSAQQAASKYADLPASVADLPDRLPFILSRPVGWNVWVGSFGHSQPVSIGMLHDPDNKLTKDNIGDFSERVIITLETKDDFDSYDRATAKPVTINGRAWSTVDTKKSGDAPVRCLITGLGTDTLGICYQNATQNDGPDQLSPFATAMTIATSADPGTWYPKAKSFG